jgi:hypothetical protein
MRTFGAVVLHVVSGNIYTARAGRGEGVNWDELDPKDYKAKAAVVALLKKRKPGTRRAESDVDSLIEKSMTRHSDRFCREIREWRRSLLPPSTSLTPDYV